MYPSTLKEVLLRFEDYTYGILTEADECRMLFDLPKGYLFYVGIAKPDTYLLMGNASSSENLPSRLYACSTKTGKVRDLGEIPSNGLAMAVDQDSGVMVYRDHRSKKLVLVDVHSGEKTLTKIEAGQIMDMRALGNNRFAFSQGNRLFGYEIGKPGLKTLATWPDKNP